MILAKIAWAFDLEVAAGQENWLDQKAYLVFEPKPLHFKLIPRGLPEQKTV
jgi:hypothetical protein